MSAPELTGLDDVSFEEVDATGTPQLIDSDVTVTDAEEDFNGGAVQVSGLKFGDVVSIRDQGTGAGQIGYNAGTGEVTFGGVVIGAAAGGSGGTFMVTLNANATTAGVEALIENLTYQTTSAAPAEYRDLRVAVYDATSNRGFHYRVGETHENPLSAFVAPFQFGQLSATFGDLDGDGDADMVVGNSANYLYFVENTGSDAEPVYTYDAGSDALWSVVPGNLARPELVDINGDGKLDILVGREGGQVRYYRNNSTTSGGETTLAFSLVTGAGTPFNSIDVGSDSSAAFSDLDGDGDLDMVVGGAFSGVRYYRNTGTATAPAWTLVSVASDPFNVSLTGAASLPAFIDADGDGDLDLVVGDFGALHYYERVDDSTTATPPQFTLRTGAANPFDGLIPDDGSVADPVARDLNGDGRADLLVARGDQTWITLMATSNGSVPVQVRVAPDEPNTAPELTVRTRLNINPADAATPRLFGGSPSAFDAEDNFDGGTLTVTGMEADDVVSLQNQGSDPGQVGYDAMTGEVTVGGALVGVAAGGQGTAFIVTFNADAGSDAVDAVLGALTYASTTSPSGDIVLTVTLTDDEGAANTDVARFFHAPRGADPFYKIAFWGSSAPALGDLDSDGDLDLAVLTDGGVIRFYDRDGDRFNEVTGAANPFTGIVEDGGFLDLVDIDADGDLDLFVNDVWGNERRYFENTGTAAAAVFTERFGVENPLSGLAEARWGAFADLDGDGDLDFLTTNSWFEFEYYENTGTTTAPVFTLQTGADNPFAGFWAGFDPSIGDIDGDGDLDVLVSDGPTLELYENVGDAQNPAFQHHWDLSGTPLSSLNLVYGAVPQFADIDNDGDDDLVWGSTGDGLAYAIHGRTNQILIHFNVPSLANDDALETGEGTILRADLYAENGSGIDLRLDGGPSSVIAVNGLSSAVDDWITLASGARVHVTSDGYVTYDPDGAFESLGQGQTTTDTFTYALTGGSTATVTVTIVGVAGTSAPDVLVVTDPTGGTLDGGAGDDVIDGATGDDTLLGGTGNDLLRGGAGDDILRGGIGDDTYTVDSPDDVVDETGGGGIDKVRASVSWTLGNDLENLDLLGLVAIDGTGNALANVIVGNSKNNIIAGLDGDDTLSGLGGDDTVQGGAGIDSIDGGIGNDLLYGGSEDDVIIGGVGNDLLDGGNGADHMTGGKGNDRYIVDDVLDVLVEDLAGGGDTVEVWIADYALADNVENVELMVGAYATANDLVNLIIGSGFDDVIHARGGNDTVNGGAGLDELHGEDGADILSGGDGADKLFGGVGSDKLTGGAGADVFAFNGQDIVLSSLGGVAAKDQVLDLNFGDGDVLTLGAIDADVNTAGDQAFVFVTKFTKVAGQALIKYTASNNTTTVTLDVDGDGKGDLQILITGDHSRTTGNLYTGAGDTDGGWML